MLKDKKISFKILQHGTREYKDAVALRESILRKPLGLIFTADELELEKDHVQIAGFIGNELCATAVLVPEGRIYKMQRVVVKENLQNSGIGSAMMEFCEKYALDHGFKEIYCHARDSAIPFYLKNNYIAEGDLFAEDTIPHLIMRKFINKKT